MSDEWADPNRPSAEGHGPPGPPAPPPGYGPPTWAAPSYPTNDNPFGPPYGSAGPPSGSPRPGRSRTALVVSGAIVLVIVLGIVGIIIDAHHKKATPDTGGHAIAGSSSPAPTAPAASPAPSAPPSGQGSTVPSSPGIPNGSSLPAGPQGSGGTTTGPLDSYLLSPTEVGATGMDLIDGGRAIDPGDATLDWCGKTYASDSLRTGRVQVEYEGSDNFVSNEFVRYSSGGTTTAYSEIKTAVQQCQPSFTDQGTVTNQIQVAAHSSSLVPDQVTLSAFEAGEVPLWTAVVYQFDGNYFSGVYVSGGSRAAVLQAAEQLGAKAANHLRQAVSGATGSGGGTVGSPAPEISAPAGGGVQT
jgi:hypothetical protein